MTQTQDWGRCKRCGWEFPIGAGDASAYGNLHGTKKKPAAVRCPLCGSADWKTFKEKL